MIVKALKSRAKTVWDAGNPLGGSVSLPPPEALCGFQPAARLSGAFQDDYAFYSV